MNNQCIDVTKAIQSVRYFRDDDIEAFQYSDRADEIVRIVQARKDKFDIETFILRSYMAFEDAEDMKMYQGLSLESLRNLLYDDFISESDKCIELVPIQKKEIRYTFILEIIKKKLNIDIEEIEDIFWLDEYITDQAIVFFTNDHSYYAYKGLG